MSEPYVLSRLALQDLTEIWNYTARRNLAKRAAPTPYRSKLRVWRSTSQDVRLLRVIQ